MGESAHHFPLVKTLRLLTMHFKHKHYSKCIWLLNSCWTYALVSSMRNIIFASWIAYVFQKYPENFTFQVFIILK